MPWFKMCGRADLNPGEGKYIEINGQGYAIFLVGEQIHTIDNYCPHAGGNLAGGWIDDAHSTSNACVVCPWHGWAFKLESGELRDSPAVKVATYPTRVKDGFVEADLPGL